jgi:signal transduction histidine kinase
MLDRLESAFATQRRFLDDAGHELRTPITIVRGHLELMGDQPDERRETLALVIDELDRMSRLVDDVLTLAKAERPDFLDRETVDVAALTREIHAKAAAIAPRDWRLAGTGRGVIVADRQRLTQALVQLAQNAVQHTGEGDAIALSSSVAAGRARFCVRDWGPGVPAADRERIFERFGRRAAARREGAGLGLAIVRAIAEAHGGRVELESAPGQGATFTVEVPVDPPGGGPAQGEGR